MRRASVKLRDHLQRIHYPTNNLLLSLRDFPLLWRSAESPRYSNRMQETCKSGTDWVAGLTEEAFVNRWSRGGFFVAFLKIGADYGLKE